VIHSEDVLLENIFVSSRSSNGYPARNTDGADTIASNRITFRGWEVDNGDDSIGVLVVLQTFLILLNPNQIQHLKRIQLTS
jgi:hypothetical protein